MSTVPAGDAGDAVQRLQDEQWHLLELFDTCARCRHAPEPALYEVSRLSTLICALLRVHDELATMLHQSLAHEPGARDAMARCKARREAMLERLERVEALSARDPLHVHEMAALAQRTRLWIQDGEEVFRLARSARLDLGAIDRPMALRQQALLSAGPKAWDGRPRRAAARPPPVGRGQRT